VHWHPNGDEWLYVIEGQARMGVFAGQGQARTFDLQAGDVGYIPVAMGHYLENTGSTSFRFLETFKSDRFIDFSLDTWMAATPPELVQAHLKLDPKVMSALRTNKALVVPE
jgi:oxalate decarboxylase